MSSRKFSNDIHRPQTRIPRPPYRLKDLCFGSSQRCRIDRHTPHSAVGPVFLGVSPCVRVSVNARSRRRHPHDFEQPVVRELTLMSRSVPQSHRQVAQRWLFASRQIATTSNRQTRVPTVTKRPPVRPDHQLFQRSSFPLVRQRFFLPKSEGPAPQRNRQAVGGSWRPGRCRF